MDASQQNRLRLWLRAERAMGLGSLPLRLPVIEKKKNSNTERPASTAPSPAAQLAAPAVKPSAVPVRPLVAPPPATRVPQPSTATTRGTVQEPVLMPLESVAVFSAPVLPTVEKRRRLEVMDSGEVRGCTRCRLSQTRTNTVFGEGDPDAKIFFIGEGPGENEDLKGRPFIGRAGELLTKMIGAMGLSREQVFIANIVKCRPPGNRVPSPDEVTTCTPYLERQIEIVRPRVIVTLGLPATRYMLKSELSMGRLRGEFHVWRGIKLMPTYHPAYVLRSYTETVRAAVWSDLKKVMAELQTAEA